MLALPSPDVTSAVTGTPDPPTDKETLAGLVVTWQGTGVGVGVGTEVGVGVGPEMVRVDVSIQTLAVPLIWTSALIVAVPET